MTNSTPDSLSVVSPSQIRWAPAKILGDFLYGEIDGARSRREWYWYIVGTADTDEYFVMDLAPERYGRCYLTTLYYFGQPGNNPVVAHSYTDLLQQLLRAADMGEQWSWYELGLGDAFA